MATTAQKTRLIGDARLAMSNFLDAWNVVATIRQRADDLALLVSGSSQLTDADFPANGPDGGIAAADFITALQTADQAVTQANRRTIVKVRY